MTLNRDACLHLFSLQVIMSSTHFGTPKKMCLIIVLDFHKMSKKKDFVCVGNILQTYKDFPSG